MKLFQSCLNEEDEIKWEKSQSHFQNTWENLSSKISDKMYNVSVGPSKIVAKTRRGISQNLESLQNLRKQIDLDDGEVMNSPRPIFHTNGKKCTSSKQQEVISPQHEELIRFVSDSWSNVFKEVETDIVEEAEGFTSSVPATSIIYYKDTEPNTFLQNFKPFDLESWWGKRLFHNITKSIP